MFILRRNLFQNINMIINVFFMLLLQITYVNADSFSVAQGDDSQVILKRDEYGVPHVYANTVYGIFYGFGYALAEDQLYQMEILRRTAKGTVSEVLGADYLNHDRNARSNYSPANLQYQLEALSGTDRDIFKGYVAGLNERVKEVLADQGNLLPYEFTVNKFSPSFWTQLDMIAIYHHSMVRRFSGGNLEIENMDLLKRLVSYYGEEKGWKIFNQMRWGYDPLAQTSIAKEDQNNASPPIFTTPDFKQLNLAGISEKAVNENKHHQMALYGATGPDAFPKASNIWVLGASKTKTGEAVLVNGPQFGNFSPGYVWSVGLHGAGFDLVGSGTMGSPWLLFGTNGHIGWGSTAGMGDTVDIYQEKLDPNNPHRYFYKGQYHDMEKRTDLIHVKGQSSVELNVYSTVHGPVILFDQENGRAYSRKRSWAGSEIRSLLAFIASMKAQNHDQWIKAISQVSLTINNYYADVEGNIAYAYLGKFPRRQKGHDLRLPITGTGEMEWQGFYPFQDNPQVLNPKKGYIANWNNKPQPKYNSSDYMYWAAIDRVSEIHEILDEEKKFSADEIWDINKRVSFIDVNARYFIPLISKASEQWPKGKSLRNAADALVQWDRNTVNPNERKILKPEYILFRTFLTILARDVLGSHFPEIATNDTSKGFDKVMVDQLSAVHPSFPLMGTKILYNALQGRNAGVPQEYDFMKGKSGNSVIRAALQTALKRLILEHGEKMGEWAVVAEPHVFQVRNYANIQQTLLKNKFELEAQMNRGTENNQIILGPQRVKYCDVTPPGQSGFIKPSGELSTHFKDQLSLYDKFTCKAQWISENQVNQNTTVLKILKYSRK